MGLAPCQLLELRISITRSRMWSCASTHAPLQVLPILFSLSPSLSICLSFSCLRSKTVFRLPPPPQKHPALDLLRIARWSLSDLPGQDLTKVPFSMLYPDSIPFCGSPLHINPYTTGTMLQFKQTSLVFWDNNIITWLPILFSPSNPFLSHHHPLVVL